MIMLTTVTGKDTCNYAIAVAKVEVPF